MVNNNFPLKSKLVSSKINISVSDQQIKDMIDEKNAKSNIFRSYDILNKRFSAIATIATVMSRNSE
jgi:hypothetical protein